MKKPSTPFPGANPKPRRPKQARSPSYSQGIRSALGSAGGAKAGRRANAGLPVDPDLQTGGVGQDKETGLDGRVSVESMRELVRGEKPRSKSR